MIQCDWCQSQDCRDTGGVEWTGHAIYVCTSCSHEWVETSVKKEKSKFWDFMKKFLENNKKNK
jgi:transposase-like protein